MLCRMYLGVLVELPTPSRTLEHNGITFQVYEHDGRPVELRRLSPGVAASVLREARELQAAAKEKAERLNDAAAERLEALEPLQAAYKRIQSGALVGEAAEALAGEGGRSFMLSLHPWVIGQPHRVRYLRDALDRLCAVDNFWSATASEIADHCRQAWGAPV